MYLCVNVRTYNNGGLKVDYKPSYRHKRKRNRYTQSVIRTIVTDHVYEKKNHLYLCVSYTK